MASKCPDIGEGETVLKFDPFSVVEKVINSTFDELVQKLNARRDKLLAELNDIKMEYLEKEKIRKEHVNSLTKLRGRYESLENKTSIQDDHFKKINADLDKYQIPTPVPLPDMTWNLKEFIDQYDEKLNFRDVTKIYQAIQTPNKTRLDEKLNKPSGIRISGRDTLYVADCWNGRIQVIRIENWEVINEVGGGKLVWPNSVDISNQFLYISDYGLNAVLKFQNKEYIGSSKEGELKFPVGVKLSENEVYVADSDNNRIAVLNLDLEFIREFGQMLKTPRDVNINQNKVFVADNSEVHNVHIFSKTGDLLSSIISLGNKGDTIFLCFDKFNNILISNGSTNQIHIYTVEGQLIHSIACEYRKGCFISNYKPTGIEVTQDNNVICADYTKNCIVMY